MSSIWGAKPPLVRLNVYDLRFVGCHSGVEICGEEFSYGDVPEKPGAKSGVWRCHPRSAARCGISCKFREAIVVGNAGSLEEVKAVVEELRLTWHASSYDLLVKNCNHFSDELCLRLTGTHIPKWVNRAANLGAVVLRRRQRADEAADEESTAGDHDPAEASAQQHRLSSFPELPLVHADQINDAARTSHQLSVPHAALPWEDGWGDGGLAEDTAGLANDEVQWASALGNDVDTAAEGHLKAIDHQQAMMMIEQMLRMRRKGRREMERSL